MIRVVQMGDHLGVLQEDEAIVPNLSAIGTVALDKLDRGDSELQTLQGMVCENQAQAKKLRKIRREKKNRDHSTIGIQKKYWQMTERSIYWKPNGWAICKGLEAKIAAHLQERGCFEVHLSGSVEVGQPLLPKEKETFTFLEEEHSLPFTSGLKDHPMQRVALLASSSLQMFEEFDKIPPLIFSAQGNGFLCQDLYGIEWEVVTRRGFEVRVWTSRLLAIFLERSENWGYTEMN